MKAFVFPGQGAQFVGMGKDLYETSPLAKELFEKANEILGYRITDIMFNGTDEDLRQTKVTQPAVFLHSVISALCLGDEFKPEMTAGHSLGEFSALVAAGALSFEDGLNRRRIETGLRPCHGDAEGLRNATLYHGGYHRFARRESGRNLCTGKPGGRSMCSGQLQLPGTNRHLRFYRRHQQGLRTDESSRSETCP